MTNAIAPVGTAIASMGRHGRRGYDAPPAHDEPVHESDEAGTAAAAVVALPPPADAPEAIMPGALFAATLMAQDLTPVGPSRSGLFAPRSWSTPQSNLRLKDAIA